jgi:Ca2+-binding EF-hand superfamily protein
MSKPTPEQIKSAFESFDADKSGDLSAQELQTGLANFNITITLEQAQDLHTKFDENKSGGLDLNEFQKIVSHYFDN